MSVQILCSTGVAISRNTIEKYSIMVDFIKQLELDRFELILYEQWRNKYRDIIKCLSASGKVFKILHCEKKIGAFFADGPQTKEQWQMGIDVFTANCQVGRELGAKKAVLHLWELPHSDTKIENNLMAVEICSEISDKNGMYLCVETIPCKRSSPLSVLKRVVDSDSSGCCSVTLDVKHMAFHGEVENIYDESWIWNLKNPAHFHVRDYKGIAGDHENFGVSLHPGEGDINFIKLLNFLRELPSLYTITLESDAFNSDGSFKMERVTQSLHWLRQFEDTM